MEQRMGTLRVRFTKITRKTIHLDLVHPFV
jgi:hypothetical protein